jgi:hypothetical protein
MRFFPAPARGSETVFADSHVFFANDREFFEQSHGKFVEIAKKRRDYNSYCLVTL